MIDEKFMDFMNDEARRIVNEMAKNAAKEHFKNEFDKTDWSQLKDKKDPELAKMQSEVPVDSPQYVMFTQEWNNRSISRQLKWVKISAIVTPLATLLAGILGAAVIYMQSTHPTPIHIEYSKIQSPPSLSAPTLQKPSLPKEGSEQNAKSSIEQKKDK